MKEVFHGLRTGDLVCQRLPLNTGYKLGTIVGTHTIDLNTKDNEPKYVKILWITHDGYPVSVKDFYEEFASIYDKNLRLLKTIDDIPEDFLETN